jgi:hypothetical protein
MFIVLSRWTRYHKFSHGRLSGYKDLSLLQCQLLLLTLSLLNVTCFNSIQWAQRAAPLDEVIEGTKYVDANGVMPSNDPLVGYLALLSSRVVLEKTIDLKLFGCSFRWL